jgi:voltage-gated sodium channel
MYLRLSEFCARLVDRRAFMITVATVILLNAVTLGLQTYDRIDDRYGEQLRALDDLFLAIFVVELAIRMIAYGTKPYRFFMNGWNLFDFIVVGAAFVPAFGANATLLRVVRVLRVARIVSVLPDLRIVLRGVVRSIAPIGAVGFLLLVTFYIYAMVGWLLFGDENPEEWGNVGYGMLTLFEVLTLEDWVDVMDRGMAIHPWSWIYFVSFVLVTAFIILNIVIAVVITSVEEARREEPAILGRTGAVSDERARLLGQIGDLRQSLEALEGELVQRRVEGLTRRGADDSATSG